MYTTFLHFCLQFQLIYWFIMAVIWTVQSYFSYCHARHCIVTQCHAACVLDFRSLSFSWLVKYIWITMTTQVICLFIYTVLFRPIKGFLIVRLFYTLHFLRFRYDGDVGLAAPVPVFLQMGPHHWTGN